MIATTQALREALALGALLVRMEAGSPIGELVGETGTGKTVAARALAEAVGGVRVAAHEGMSRYGFLARVLEALGREGPYAQWLRLVEDYAREHAPAGGGASGDGARRPLLVVDEANKLGWQALEMARWLADEAGFALCLVGTELYEQRFVSARTRPLLLQLGRRIGAKRVRFGHLDRAECYAHVIKPRLGEIADLAWVTRFWQGCRRGNWGEAVELGEECRRILHAQGMATPTPAVLEAALAWSANRRAVA